MCKGVKEKTTEDHVVTEKERKEFFDLMKADRRTHELAKKQLKGTGITKEEFQEYFDLMDAKLEKKRCHDDFVELNKMIEEKQLSRFRAYDRDFK